eukprot:5868327-Amphidinium_carterae.1
MLLSVQFAPVFPAAGPYKQGFCMEVGCMLPPSGLMIREKSLQTIADKETEHFVYLLLVSISNSECDLNVIVTFTHFSPLPSSCEMYG